MRARAPFSFGPDETARFEERCAGLVTTLQHADGDEIRLLRVARMLKLANRDLKVAVQQAIRQDGWTHRTGLATVALDSMELHLRQALLARVSHDQLHQHLVHAADCSFDALEALHQE